MIRKPIFQKLLIVLCFLVGEITSEAKTKKNILCTTFPVYQITRNIVGPNDQTRVKLLLPSQLGCPHDYALTPQDMMKLSRSNILVINGLGLEEFMGAPIKKANRKITIIDSTKHLPGLLHYTKEEACDHGCAHGHHKSRAYNPHLFASPARVAEMTMRIAGGLAKNDPGNAVIYLENGTKYAGKMNKLAKEFSELGTRLKNNRIVAQQSIFDYLAKDMGLEIIAVIQAHGGLDPSAAEILNIVRKIKKDNAGAVFSQPQYSDKISKVIAKEAKIPEAKLDPVATGPQGAPLDYYEKIMRRNLATLKTILGPSNGK